MNRRLSTSLLAFVTLIALFSLPAHAAPRGDQVQAELLADVASIQPGKPFTLGVRLTLQRGWHVYWENPGDSGIPTTVDFVLPEGFTVGELQYPLPQRIEQPGGIVNYGYEHEVMLLAKVTPPKDLPIDKSVHVVAKVNWLVCREECYPGRAETALDLPVAQQAAESHRDVFDQWRRRLPVPAEQLSGVGVEAEPLDLSSGRGRTKITTTVAINQPAIPGAADGLELKISPPQNSNSGTRFTVDAEVLKGQTVKDKFVEVLVGPYVVKIPLVGAAGPATAPQTR